MKENLLKIKKLITTKIELEPYTTLLKTEIYFHMKHQLCLVEI